MAWQILYYVRPNGRSPYNDWFGDLDSTIQNYIATALDRMAEYEQLGDCRLILGGEGLRERRLHARGGWRIYFIQECDRIILFCGGKKEDQTRDIGRAKGYLADYRG